MTEITIPNKLVERIDSRVDRTDFESADEYATFVLSEVVTRVERNTDTAEISEESGEDVEDRLQSLGYLE